MRVEARDLGAGLRPARGGGGVEVHGEVIATSDGGYSGTPLAKKLGIAAGAAVALIGEPEGFRSDLEPLPPGVVFRTSLRGRPDVVVLFAAGRAAFERRLAVAGRAIFPDGSIWVAWPKRASRLPTNMSGDVVREVALPSGLVDNKVCSIDATWTALRVVWRIENRPVDR